MKPKQAKRLFREITECRTGISSAIRKKLDIPGKDDRKITGTRNRELLLFAARAFLPGEHIRIRHGSKPCVPYRPLSYLPGEIAAVVLLCVFLTAFSAENRRGELILDDSADGLSCLLSFFPENRDGFRTAERKILTIYGHCAAHLMTETEKDGNFRFSAEGIPQKNLLPLFGRKTEESEILLLKERILRLAELLSSDSFWRENGKNRQNGQYDE